MREKKRETCRLPDSKKKEKKGRKISKVSRKKPTFVKNLKRNERERERAPSVNGRINQQVSKWREKSPRGAERSKNRGRLKSHKETEEEGGESNSGGSLTERIFLHSAHLQDGKGEDYRTN